MKAVELIVIGILLTAAIGFTIWYQARPTNGPAVCFENDCFDVEVANENAERIRGLMNRESLGEDQGMLFVWDEEGVYQFWMKDTLIPLDMIWINSDYEIVFIKENAQPLDLTPIDPGVAALYVVEVNGGTAAERGIAVGDSVRFVGIEE